MNFNLFLGKSEKENKEIQKSKDIFGDYDIRGVYPNEVNEETFFLLAAAIAKFLKLKKVVIGHDSRLSSPALVEALRKGFQAQGVDVMGAGMLTTPLCAWIANVKGIDSCIVTASHNPPDHNGLKIYSRKKGAVDRNDGLVEIEKELNNLLASETDLLVESSKKGSFKRIDFIDEYQRDFIKRVTKPKAKLRIAVDYSNGTSGLVLNKILEKLGIHFTTINENPDGNFPGHSPNPLKEESHKKIEWLIQSGRYNLGAIFDGDGDRIVFFDEKGKVISASQIFSLLVDFYLPQTDRFKNIVVTSSFSKTSGEIAESHGGKVYISPVGRTNISPLMKEKRAVMAAEVSGHYFFKEIGYEDSAALALIKVLNILATKKNSISKLVEPFQKRIILSEINIDRVDGTEKYILKELRDIFPGGKVSRIDGLNVEYKDWWFNIRASNTQDLWRLTLEGEDEDLLVQKREEIEEVINNFELED